MVERLTTFTCKLCRRPVLLKECVTDDIGDPMHLDCYEEQTRQREQEQKKLIANGQQRSLEQG